MNLPFPWMGASLAAAPAVLQSAGQVAGKTSEAFGDLLSQILHPSDNGPSEPAATSKATPSAGKGPTKRPMSWSDVQKAIQSWLEGASKRFGTPYTPGSVSLEVDHQDRVTVHGAEPFRQDLEQELARNPDWIDGMLSHKRGEDQPLAWLPGQNIRSASDRVAASQSERQLMRFVL